MLSFIYEYEEGLCRCVRLQVDGGVTFVAFLVSSADTIREACEMSSLLFRHSCHLAFTRKI